MPSDHHSFFSRQRNVCPVQHVLIELIHAKSPSEDSIGIPSIQIPHVDCVEAFSAPKSGGQPQARDAGNRLRRQRSSRRSRYLSASQHKKCQKGRCQLGTPACKRQQTSAFLLPTSPQPTLAPLWAHVADQGAQHPEAQAMHELLAEQSQERGQRFAAGACEGAFVLGLRSTAAQPVTNWRCGVGTSLHGAPRPVPGFPSPPWPCASSLRPN